MAGQSTVAFVNFEYLQANSPVYANLDPADINWIIAPSQDRNLERLLGTALYTKLKNEISPSGATKGSYTGATQYKTLIDDYLSPALVYYIVLDAVDFNAMKFTNKGILRKSSDNSDIATPPELQEYKDKMSTFAEYYGERTVDYLCANPDLFPEYNNPGSDSDTIYPVRTAYNSTFYFPNRGGSRKTYDRPKFR